MVVRQSDVHHGADLHLNKRGKKTKHISVAPGVNNDDEDEEDGGDEEEGADDDGESEKDF